MRDLLRQNIIRWAAVACLFLAACGSEDAKFVVESKGLLVITPPLSSVNIDTVLQYTASWVDEAGLVTDVTDKAAWSSTSPDVATVTADGLARGTASGTTGIVAMMGRLRGAAQLEVTSKTVSTVAILPAETFTLVGLEKQFTAVARYADGSLQEITAVAQWDSSDPTVASVSAGAALGVRVGKTTMTASFSGQSASATLVVSPAAPVGIVADPVQTTLPAGTKARIHCILMLDDGTSIDVTEACSWAGDNDKIAQVSNAEGKKGEVSAVSPGTMSVLTGLTFNNQTIATSATVTVTPAVLKNLEILPSTLTLPQGTTTHYSAIGFYSDSSHRDVTRESLWSSDNTSVLSIVSSGDDAGRATAIGTGLATVTASFMGLSANTAAAVSEAEIENLVITPASISVPVGTQGTFTATAIFSDSTHRDVTREATWISSETSVVWIATNGTEAGDATAVAPGTATITADYGGLSAERSAEVTEATITGLEITPTLASIAKGSTQPFSATAYYSDTTSEDVTELATWSSTNTTVAEVSNQSDHAGVATAHNVGETDITASFDGLTGNATLSVTAAPLVSIVITMPRESIPAGHIVKYKATGIYSDKSSHDLTLIATWRSSAPTIASVDTRGGKSGLAQGHAPGIADISASFQGVSGSVPLTVTAAALQSIQITPAKLNDPAGTSGYFTATGHLTDGTAEDVTTLATWTSSNPDIVSVVSSTGPTAGFTSLLKPGTADVTATVGDISDTVPVVVTSAVLTKIQISPRFANVPSGLTMQYHAVGIYSDGTITPINEDVAWQTGNQDVAFIDQDGLAHTVGAGPTTVKASHDGIIAQATLLVTGARIADIQVTPGSLTEPSGTTGNLNATAILTDGTTEDITQEATWISSNPEVVTVVSGGEDSGLVFLHQEGHAVVTAAMPGIKAEGTASITVNPATLVEIHISPVLYNVPAGKTVQYTAEGIYSDGNRTPIDNDVNWRSSNINVATIELSGLAQTLVEGTTTITATHASGIQGATDLVVTAATFERIELSPKSITMPKGTTESMLVTGIFSDGSTQPLTVDIIWNSSAPSVAVIDNGRLFALETGTATITAEYNESGAPLSDTSQVMVTEATLDSITVSTDNPTIHTGETTRFIATGHYSDNTAEDLTEEVTWASDDKTIALISNVAGEKGQTWGNGPGQTTVHATYQSLSASHPIFVSAAELVTIEVTPVNVTTYPGLYVEYRAKATYSDNRTDDITDSVRWASSSPDVAEIGANGVAVARATGTAAISAEKDGILGSTTLTVASLLPTTLEIVPGTATIALGTGIQFSALLTINGIPQDITDQVVWSSLDTSIATVSNADGSQGHAESVSVGTVQIKAVCIPEPGGEPLVAFATLEIQDIGNKPVWVEVVPDEPSIATNQTLQFRLYGYWEVTEDVYNEQDLTFEPQTVWTSSDKNTANISNNTNKGLATGIAEGKSEIKGAYRGINDATDLTVTSP